MTALEVLQRVFGYHSFRGHQEEVITRLVRGEDVALIMPTGGGKSLCYQIPALVRPGIGVVVSPLIALMQDQVEGLKELGVKAAFLNSTVTGREARTIYEQARKNQLDLLYVAPERLTMPNFLEFLKTVPLALFAIDEAHCVSQWGHDFRPDYLKLSLLHELFPSVPRIAVTATADELTREEIRTRLKLDAAPMFIAGFDRPNISYQIVIKDGAREQLLSFLDSKHRDNSGIIYCLSRKKVEDTAAWLVDKGWNALPYHAALPKELRQRNQERFLREEKIIIVATIAFGMGIDKPDVRFVCHLDLPKSIEAYYQETGRAGRDGEPAEAWMTYSLADVVTMREMMQSSDASEEFKRQEVRRLNALLGVCETTGCRRAAVLHYFGQSAPERCNNCDNCLEPVQSWDGTVVAQKALSAVYRTGERFGVTYLVEVLLGKKSERLLRFGHDKLPTFGVGQELSEAEWHSVFRQLVAGGIVDIDLGGWGSILLNQHSKAVLKGERPVMLRKDLPKSRGRQKRARTGTVTTRSHSFRPSLYEELRLLRKKLADERRVPAYVIFHDATLIEMAEKTPRTVEAMQQITGVGERKLESFGDDFLRLIQQHAPTGGE